MKWEKLIDAITKTKSVIDGVAETFHPPFEVESIADDTGESGVKAVSKGGEGVGSIGLNAGPVKCRFQIEPDANSTLEIWQKNGKRGVTLRKPGNVTWEVDWEELHKFGTAKAAGLACAAGAAFGLLGWLGLTLAGNLLSKKDEVDETKKALEESGDTG
ncbi:TPA: hypothetical protein EYP66_08585 [Candidatus Poribacteria bacterium]|nr:hypothetical protein [Candidatus Poribacteria bacterium]